MRNIFLAKPCKKWDEQASPKAISKKIKIGHISGSTVWKKHVTFMARFYGWGSTASRREPLGGGSLLFTTKFPDISGTHFTDLGRVKDWVDLGATQWFLNTGPLDWESSALTTRPLIYFITRPLIDIYKFIYFLCNEVEDHQNMLKLRCWPLAPILYKAVSKEQKEVWN